jgi:hypothetical protein
MTLGDLVYGEFPTRYASAMRVFPDGPRLLASVPVSAADQDGVFPNSIGQDAGRSSMAAGALPGRYYGASWLAPNSGGAPSVAGSLLTGNGAGDGSPAGSLDGSGSIGPATLTNPLPSITAPRANQFTAAEPCTIASWVSRNPVLAIGTAVLVYFAARGRK